MKVCKLSLQTFFMPFPIAPASRHPLTVHLHQSQTTAGTNPFHSYFSKKFSLFFLSPFHHTHLQKVRGESKRRFLSPIHSSKRTAGIKKEPRTDSTSARGFIKYLQTAKLSFFCNNFERNFNRNFLVKFNDCLIVANFLNLILNNDNLTIDVVTQFSQFFSNLDVTY